VIIFQTTGNIDLNAVTTLGVSVKSSSAIGYFGTGLKFAIAVLLRHDAEINIYTNGKKHVFSKTPTTIRDQPFDIVALDGVQLGFTTQLGRDWELWMAFREIACNTLDEKGSYGLAPDDTTIHFVGDQSIITVKLPAFDDIYKDREKFIITRTPIAETDSFAVHSVLERNAVHYKNIRVGKLNKPSVYTYNVRGELDLTEDRTYKDGWQLSLIIGKGIAKLSDEEMLVRILTAHDQHYEHLIVFQTYWDYSEQFLATAQRLVRNKVPILPHVKEMLKDKKLITTEYRPVLLESHQSLKLNRAKTLLTNAGYPIEKYKIILTNDLDADCYGLAVVDTIYISPLVFTKGTREVAATLLEEFGHLESKADDCTREFQNYWIDQLLTKIELQLEEPF
jgi:hypothetical protein